MDCSKVFNFLLGQQIDYKNQMEERVVLAVEVLAVEVMAKASGGGGKSKVFTCLHISPLSKQLTKHCSGMHAGIAR